MFLNFLQKSQKKHLCWSLSFNKVAGLRTAILLKKRLWCRYFPMNFAKILGTPFLQNTSRRLLLLIHLISFNTFFEWFLLTENVDFEIAFNFCEFGKNMKTYSLLRHFSVKFEVMPKLLKTIKNPLLLNS